jgi:hypothetical protein
VLGEHEDAQGWGRRVYVAKTANAAICRVMSEYEGQCIDVLTPFNGRDGTENHEDCCYPSATGQ